jgi:hypothetical protein
LLVAVELVVLVELTHFRILHFQYHFLALVVVAEVLLFT